MDTKEAGPRFAIDGVRRTLECYEAATPLPGPFARSDDELPQQGYGEIQQIFLSALHALSATRHLSLIFVGSSRVLPLSRKHRTRDGPIAVYYG